MKHYTVKQLQQAIAINNTFKGDTVAYLENNAAIMHINEIIQDRIDYILNPEASNLINSHFPTT